MGYLVRKSNTARMMATVNSPSPMAGWAEDIGDVLITFGTGNSGQVLTAIAAATNDADQRKCIADANASGAVARIDATITDIAKNWQPSGYYTPAQIDQVVALITANLLGPLSAVQAAPQTTSDAADLIAGYVAKLNRDMGLDPAYTGTTANTFSAGAAAARAAGATVVEAPGLKRWVVLSLMDASAALVATSVYNCNATILDDVNKALVSLGLFLKSIGSLVVGVAEAVFKIPDTVSKLWTILKYGAIAGAGYLIWKEFLKGKLGK